MHGEQKRLLLGKLISLVNQGRHPCLPGLPRGAQTLGARNELQRRRFGRPAQVQWRQDAHTRDGIQEALHLWPVGDHERLLVQGDVRYQDASECRHVKPFFPNPALRLEKPCRIMLR